MEKTGLINILSEILLPFGYKRKGDYWILNGDEIKKVINLQKSQFENSFYINYGYIVKAVPIENLMMHVFQRFGSVDDKERVLTQELLNLESSISNEERAKQLKQLIINKVVIDLQKVNTEEDLISELKMRPHLNNIPLIVKKHFNIQ